MIEHIHTEVTPTRAGTMVATTKTTLPKTIPGTTALTTAAPSEIGAVWFLASSVHMSSFLDSIKNSTRPM